jgi:hypothetical protein
MEALKLAFETVIVGALALPWLFFVLDLFFIPKNDDNDQGWPPWSSVKAKMGEFTSAVPLSAVAGVLLFVAAYFVGVVVTRASGDFFNDELPGWAPTEDNIRSAAYCELASKAAPLLYVKSKSGAIESEAGLTELSRTAMGVPKSEYRREPSECGNNEEAKKAIQRLFYVREGALLLEGGDKTDRLNQLHSQILVLRGAAFNALLTFMLCLFGLGGRPSLRDVWWAIPLIPAGFGFWFLHIHAHPLTDPPLMEIILIVLGLVGGYALWKGAPEGKYVVGSLLLSLLALVIAFLGWWWSELLYDQQVFYSFYAQSQHLLDLAK